MILIVVSTREDERRGGGGGAERVGAEARRAEEGEAKEVG